MLVKHHPILAVTGDHPGIAVIALGMRLLSRALRGLFRGRGGALLLLFGLFPAGGQQQRERRQGAKCKLRQFLTVGSGVHGI